MYHIDIKHDGLRKFRRLSGADRYVLEQRARVQSEAWDGQWRRRLARYQDSDETLRHLPNFEAQKAHAARLTDEAQQAIAAWGTILRDGLDAPSFKMDALYDGRIFPEPRPAAPMEQQAPPEPDRDDPSFNCVETYDVVAEFWSLFLPSLRRKREQAAQERKQAAQSRYESALRSWQNAKHEIARLNAKASAMFETALDEWWKRAQAHKKQQQDENIQVEKFRQDYAQGKRDAVLEFLDAALSQAEYPDAFPMRWEMGFLPESAILTVDYELPSPEDFPRLKAVKYDVVGDTFEQVYLSPSEIAELYEGAIYQACLRTLHALSVADEAGVIASIAFNGWVNFTDKLHGRPARACILSVQAGKAAILQADLRKLDPKTGFGLFQGAAGANLADMHAVAPIQPSKRTDDGFPADAVLPRSGPPLNVPGSQGHR